MGKLQILCYIRYCILGQNSILRQYSRIHRLRQGKRIHKISLKCNEMVKDYLLNSNMNILKGINVEIIPRNQSGGNNWFELIYDETDLYKKWGEYESINIIMAVQYLNLFR